MIELNKIILGDCAEVLKTFPDNCIDLTVTSPPYDNLRTYKGYIFDFETIAKELYRVTKQGGVVVWVVGDETKNGSESLTSCKQKIFFREQCGFNIHDTMIYEKEGLPLTHDRYEQYFEYMFVLSKGKPKTFNPIKEPSNTAGHKSKIAYHSDSINDNGKLGGKQGKSIIRNVYKTKGNIWRYTIGSNSTNDNYSFRHPAIFPEKLAKDHIYSWSNENDTVLDPMCGSGTTLKSALQMNRNYIGIEIAKEYHTLSVKRIEDYKSQMKMEFKEAI